MWCPPARRRVREQHSAPRPPRRPRRETFLDVASDQKSPFSVATAFSVRLRDRTLNVVVTEGRVALRAAEPQTQTGALPARVSQPVEVSAGQSAIVDQGVEDISTVQPAALQKAMDWQDGCGWPSISNRLGLRRRLTA